LHFAKYLNYFAGAIREKRNVYKKIYEHVIFLSYEKPGKVPTVLEKLCLYGIYGFSGLSTVLRILCLLSSVCSIMFAKSFNVRIVNRAYGTVHSI